MELPPAACGHTGRSLEAGPLLPWRGLLPQPGAHRGSRADLTPSCHQRPGICLGRGPTLPRSCPSWRMPLPGPTQQQAKTAAPPQPGRACQGSCPRHTGSEPRGPQPSLCPPSARTSHAVGLSEGRLTTPPKDDAMAQGSTSTRAAHRCVPASTASRMAGVTAEGAQVTQCKPPPATSCRPLMGRGLQASVFSSIKQEQTGQCPPSSGPQNRSQPGLLGSALGVHTLDPQSRGHWRWGLPSGCTH